MKRIDILSTDYWLNNTKKIYEENLHVSTSVMEAYEAGYKQAISDAIKEFDKVYKIGNIGLILYHLHCLGDNEE